MNTRVHHESTIISMSGYLWPLNQGHTRGPSYKTIPLTSSWPQPRPLVSGQALPGSARIQPGTPPAVVGRERSGRAPHRRKQQRAEARAHWGGEGAAADAGDLSAL